MHQQVRLRRAPLAPADRQLLRSFHCFRPKRLLLGLPALLALLIGRPARRRSGDGRRRVGLAARTRGANLCGARADLWGDGAAGGGVQVGAVVLNRKVGLACGRPCATDGGQRECVERVGSCYAVRGAVRFPAWRC
jgi:hypothetical protein